MANSCNPFYLLHACALAYNPQGSVSCLRERGASRGQFRAELQRLSAQGVAGGIPTLLGAEEAPLYGVTKRHLTCVKLMLLCLKIIKCSFWALDGGEREALTQRGGGKLSLTNCHNPQTHLTMGSQRGKQHNHVSEDS